MQSCSHPLGLFRQKEVVSSVPTPVPALRFQLYRRLWISAHSSSALGGNSHTVFCPLLLVLFHLQPRPVNGLIHKHRHQKYLCERASKVFVYRDLSHSYTDKSKLIDGPPGGWRANVRSHGFAGRLHVMKPVCVSLRGAVAEAALTGNMAGASQCGQASS